jgi:hypothetical protein
MNWTCTDTRRSMLRQLDLPDEAIEHLSSCELCQQVSDIATVAATSNCVEPSLDVERLLASTQQELAQERGALAWLRSRPLSLQLALGLGAALVPVGLQWVFARRGDLSEFPAARMLAFVVAYGIAIAYATIALLTPLYRPRSPVRAWNAAVLAAVVPLLFVATNHHVSSNIGTSVGLGPLGGSWACLRYGVFLAIPSVILLLAMDRTATRRRLIGFVAAALGGAVGNFVLLLHCSNREIAHQFFGHAMVGVVLLILMGAVGAFAKIGPWR